MSAFWSIGFRPFFLFAALFSAAWIPLWRYALYGGYLPTGPIAGPIWHAHEMIFGYAAAVIAGFLLTAVRNWTGRDTAQGASLVGLAALWAAGRLLLVTAAYWPPLLVAVVDCAFLPWLTFFVARPIWAQRQRRNIGFVFLLSVMFVANVIYHAVGHVAAVAVWLPVAQQAALDAITVMMVLVGGRIIPMFTGNAIRTVTIRPRTKIDIVAMVSAVVLLLINLLGVPTWLLGVVCAIAALANLARMRGWGTVSAMGVPLLAILHIGYLWIGIGFGLRALAQFWPVIAPTMATHAMTAGAIGTLTLAMMTRVALGHTGRPLVASRLTVVSYLCLTLAALTRVATPMLPLSAQPTLLTLAATLWSGAFAIYLMSYFRILTTPRVSVSP